MAVLICAAAAMCHFMDFAPFPSIRATKYGWIYIKQTQNDKQSYCKRHATKYGWIYIKQTQNDMLL
jgi:hypothetical protein